MPKLNMESLLPFIEEAFNRGMDFQIPITGTSMNPLLYQNRDFVKIVKPVLPLKVGDIPLYRRDDGTFVLHRVVGIKAKSEYIMCGDNQFILEYGITDKNIIGVAKTLIIDGKEIDVDTDTDYLKHKDKYLKNLNTRYPVRQLRYRLHNVKCKMQNAKCKMSGAAHGDCNKVQDAESYVRNDKLVGNGLERSAENEKNTQEIIKTGGILVSAIKAYITGDEFEFPENADFEKIYKLAQSHRVTAMVAPVVMKSQFADSKVKGIFSKELFKTAARYSAQEKEREDISRAFSENEIPHCFLKGSKVGIYYDNPDCRFMVDMDLYVDSQRFKDAEKILLNRGYEISSNSDDKDTVFIKKPFLTVELHKDLKYDYDKGYDYYKGAFERMNYGNGFAMNMTNEDFYVYVLSHVAHHVETAGTGIKSIVDHYYLRKNLKPKCDSAVLEKALAEIGLSKFEEKIDRLCDFWFENGESDSLTEKMTEYILLSGVFGNKANDYLNGIIRRENSKITDSYFITRLFPPLKKMQFRYKILNKYPFLLPVFWGIRIISSLRDGSRIAGETKTLITTDDSTKEQQKEFFDKMGL